MKQTRRGFLKLGLASGVQVIGGSQLALGGVKDNTTLSVFNVLDSNGIISEENFRQIIVDDIIKYCLELPQDFSGEISELYSGNASLCARYMKFIDLFDTFYHLGLCDKTFRFDDVSPLQTKEENDEEYATRMNYYIKKLSSIFQKTISSLEIDVDTFLDKGFGLFQDDEVLHNFGEYNVGTFYDREKGMIYACTYFGDGVTLNKNNIIYQVNTKELFSMGTIKNDINKIFSDTITIIQDINIKMQNIDLFKSNLGKYDNSFSVLFHAAKEYPIKDFGQLLKLRDLGVLATDNLENGNSHSSIVEGELIMPNDILLLEDSQETLEEEKDNGEKLLLT